MEMDPMSELLLQKATNPNFFGHLENPNKGGDGRLSEEEIDRIIEEFNKNELPKYQKQGGQEEQKGLNENEKPPTMPEMVKRGIALGATAFLLLTLAPQGKIIAQEQKTISKNQQTIRMNRSNDHKLESIIKTSQEDFGIPQPEFPKITMTNPSWYDLKNQPETALTEERTDIRIRIGNINAWINNEVYRLDAAPYIKPPGRTMVPLRFIAEGLGAEVGWDGIERKVTINYRGETIELWIGKTLAKVNGQNYLLDVAPEIKNGRTFVPIRFIAEAFGAKVGWNSQLKEVSIEEVIKKINEWSDADYDGLYFKEEKELGLNPNNPNTVYDSISDKQLAELIRKYPGLNIFLKYPDGRTKLTLNQKLYFEIDPRKPNNFNESVLDDVAIEYTKFVWENIYKKITKITKEHVLAEMKNLGEITYGKEIGKYLLQNLTMETIPVIDFAGEDLKRMQELGLMEKLGVELTNDYVKRVIQFEDGVIYTAGVLATLSDEFISENKDYINDLKKIKDLGFIAWVLNEYPSLTLEKQAELKNSIIIDPGIGFGKRLADNYEILRRLSEFQGLGCPVLIGPSRKSFIGNVLNLPPDQRLEGTAAAVAIGIQNGAHIVRVHDVKEMKRVCLIADRLMGKE